MTQLIGHLAATRLYARGSLTATWPDTTPRIHTKADQERAICGAAPASRTSSWLPAHGEVTCPKCLGLLRWQETV